MSKKADRMLPQKVLVCASADAELTVEGTTFDRACSQCKARVLVAPSGRAALAMDPSLVLLSVPCEYAAITRSSENSVELAAPPSEIAHELDSVQSNPRGSEID